MCLLPHLFAFASLAALLPAQEELQTTLEAGYATRHVFRGVEYAGGGAEASATLARAGFSGSLHLSQPFGGGEPGTGRLAAGYAFKLTEQMSLEAVAAQQWLTDAPAGATRRSAEAGLAATWKPVGGMTAALAWHHDFRLKADTFQASLAAEVPLTRLGAFLGLRFVAGTSLADNLRPDAAGPRIEDGYSFWGAEVRLPYRVGEHTTLVLGARLDGARDQAPAWSPLGRGDGVRGGASFAISFDF